MPRSRRPLGCPEEIADVVVFVAGPCARGMTGANVVVDGGATEGMQLSIGAGNRGDSKRAQPDSEEHP